MQIELEKDFCKLIYDDKGLRREKLVLLSDLLEELSTYRETNFGLLPKNVRLCASKGNRLVVGIEFEKAQRVINFTSFPDSVRFDHVSLPAGILLQKLNVSGSRYIHVNSYIFAIRGRRIQFPNDRLYHYPTPNVYSDGRVCWGGVNLGEINSLSATEGVVSSFFSNQFNSDLFYDRVVSSSSYASMSAESFFNHLNENEFDDGCLRETSYTVDQITNILLRGQNV